MAYARYSNSTWYAYWDASRSDKDIQKEQWLTFCLLCSFEFEHIRTDTEECLKILAERAFGSTGRDIDEARHIFNCFVADIILARKFPPKESE